MTTAAAANQRVQLVCYLLYKHTFTVTVSETVEHFLGYLKVLLLLVVVAVASYRCCLPQIAEIIVAEELLALARTSIDTIGGDMESLGTLGISKTKCGRSSSVSNSNSNSSNENIEAGG